MKSWERWILYPLLVCMGSIITCCWSPRIIEENDLGFDYLGLIVGVLSLLVTILIGWNIYTLIDFESKINKTVNKILNEKAESVYDGIIGENIEQDRDDAVFYTIQGDYPKLAFLYNRMLRSYMKLHKDEQINTMINTINILIDKHGKRIPLYFINILFDTLKKLNIEHQNEEIKNNAEKAKLKIRHLMDNYSK
ncbi:hypothetical protein [Paraprevotella xylaniphila]|uniref:hypothetical protein n=1 Tax=Paraprevotella xylaniphila TaxID=454155 RepID=UPI0020656C98|nr:hypothetical protein [Paraprevotella xylaniphila]DAZ47122.1 MAG TPA: hypothetical protein [Caudoviricetes sp.]